MPRRKPASAKQRKAELQLKRAVKRGDAPQPEKERKPRPKKGTRRLNSVGFTLPNAAGGSTHSGLSSKRLASAFAKISPEFLAFSKERASNEILERPFPVKASWFPIDEIEPPGQCSFLSCPRRPKWRFEMEKKEVERNEEGQFTRWLSDTDTAVDRWRRGTSSNVRETDPETEEHMALSQNQENGAILRPPTYFERNLEVWRQLWRVCELSQILLVLLDARCPLVHYPPSLHTYLTSLRPARKIILALTKVDVVGLERAEAWEQYLRHRFGDEVRIVKVSSYKEQVNSGQVQGRTREPDLPAELRLELLRNLRACHQELCTPPSVVQEDPIKLKNWRPRVKTRVDWDHNSHKFTRPIDIEPEGEEIGQEDPSSHPERQEQFLTIGLIGQPNVGKSSLLNALFGERRVKASRTPGKTKHFQTLFLTADIRFVDCPGLVFPAYVPMELQVLSAILPISQIPSIPSCVNFVLRHIPLEKIFNLSHPNPIEQDVVDKRTWRADRTQKADEEETKGVSQDWTTMDVLTAYALKNGWVTAKAGRPDVNRAGNALLRILAEAKVCWGFVPPLEETGIPSEETGISNEGDKEEVSTRGISNDGDGIWIRGETHGVSAEESEESGDEEEESMSDISQDGGDSGDEQSTSEGESEEETDESDVEKVIVSGGRFGALFLDT